MKSVYFIPTNRNCEKCLKSYIKEIIFAKKQYNIDIPFVVVETNDFEVAKQNSITINELQKNYPDVEIIHLTTDIQKKYFDVLFENIEDGDKIKKIFTDTSSNYGTAMNKIAIFTSAFGADTFHRRDSDTRLIHDELSNVRKVFPIEYEIEYLGKKIGEFDNIRTDSEQINNKVVSVVGGNYFGEWNLDVKDFAKKDFNIVYKLYEFLGFDKECVKEICDEAFQFDQKFVDEDHLTLVTSVNDGLNPDCGNVAVYKIHEYLPNVPGRNTLAADYFIFDSATALGLPSIHHTRATFHEYNSERFNIDRKKKYWYGMAKFADYFNSYGTIFNDSILDFDCNEKVMISDTAISALSDRIRGFIGNIHDERTKRINDIAENILLSFNEDYANIGKMLIENSKNYIDEADCDYEEHLMLIKNWNKIIKKAKSISIRDFI